MELAADASLGPLHEIRRGRWRLQLGHRVHGISADYGSTEGVPHVLTLKDINLASNEVS